MPKYNNKKIKIRINNKLITFDSKAEATRASDLWLLQLAGVIYDLEFQPEYELQEGFRRNGKAHRAIKYVADFQYTCQETGVTIVEDVKGMKTQAYQIKKKMFLKDYGDDYVFREVYISAKKTEIKEI